MIAGGLLSGIPNRETRMANAGPSTPVKFYKGMGYQQDFGAGRVNNVKPKPGVNIQDVYGIKKVDLNQNKFRNLAQGIPEDDSKFERYLKKTYGLEKTDKRYRNMPGYIKRDIRDGYRDDVERGYYKDQSSILKKAGDFVANVFTPPAVAGTLDGMPTRFTMGESNVTSMSTPSVGDMVSNIEAAVESGGRGGLGGSSSTVKTISKKQPRVVSPMESGMGPGAAKARAMAKARNAAKESGTSTPSMSGADRAKALAKARIAKKKSASSGTGFGGSTSSSTSSGRRSTGRAGRRGGSAGSAGSRSRGGTSRGSSRSGTRSSSSRGQGSRSRSTSRSRGGSFGGSRRRGGRRGRRGGRRCDIRLKYDINILSNYNLYKDDLAQVAYFVMDIKN